MQTGLGLMFVRINKSENFLKKRDIWYASNTPFRFRMVSLFALILLYYKLIPPQILFWCKYRHGHSRLFFSLCLLWLAVEVWKQHRGQRPFFVFFLVWSSLVCRGHSEEGGHNQWCTDSPMSCTDDCELYTMHSNLHHDTLERGCGLYNEQT